MTPPLTSADHVELVSLSTEMAHLVDHHEPQRVHELFTTDGRLIIGEDRFEGRAALVAWGEARARSGRETRHTMTNHRLERDGDEHATGVVVTTVFVEDPQRPGAIGEVIVGEYHDEYVRTSGAWRFATRRFTKRFELRPPAAT